MSHFLQPYSSELPHEEVRVDCQKLRFFALECSGVQLFLKTQWKTFNIFEMACKELLTTRNLRRTFLATLIFAAIEPLLAPSPDCLSKREIVKGLSAEGGRVMFMLAGAGTRLGGFFHCPRAWKQLRRNGQKDAQNDQKTWALGNYSNQIRPLPPSHSMDE